MVVVLRWVAWAGVTVEHFPCLLSILSFSAVGGFVSDCLVFVDGTAYTTDANSPPQSTHHFGNPGG